MAYRDPERQKAYAREWLRRFPEKARAAAKKWNHAHPEMRREQKRRQYARDPEKARAQREAWHALHPEVRQISSARKRGGTNYIANILPACPRCNLTKATRTEREFRVRLLNETLRSGEFEVVDWWEAREIQSVS